jgi:hypothetical protein
MGVDIRGMTIQEKLRRLGGDQFIQRLIQDIEDVALSTDETRGKGKIVLTVKTSKHKNSETGDGYVEFETQLVATHPSRPARMTGLYVDQEGLHGDDPKQSRLDLRAVETPTATVRQSDADTTVREA